MEPSLCWPEKQMLKCIQTFIQHVHVKLRLNKTQVDNWLQKLDKGFIGN